MSMPAYLEVAVVASTERPLHQAASMPALNKKGVAPRYRLVSLDRPTTPGVEHFGSVPPEQIGFWVALDTEALDRCKALPAYPRGFYDHWLPERVAYVTSSTELEEVAAEIWEAFCATS